MTALPQDLVVCEHCDAVHRRRALASDEVARCSRCAGVLARGHRLTSQSTIALTLAALFVFLIALFARVATIRLGGSESAATLPDAIQATWLQGAPLVASIAAFTAIVAPGVLIILRLYLLLPLATGHVPRHFGIGMRVLYEVSRWSMVEVLMVAAAVSIVRLASLADATLGFGMFAFGALALLLAALESAGLRHLWLEPA
ncbi:paraquat-inducible protein A [Piscinibacter sp.]|uniref:paraquat-inducible protein A n=1 Tax=Piscinibacter sp. TaxID=1903157 RepID=UPI002BF55190|nr:paraquat-inducible protein A [Albitalea sp.]HUG25121.1 paraquat-inducible protein A [Albitalea sp.]